MTMSSVTVYFDATRIQTNPVTVQTVIALNSFTEGEASLALD